MSSFQSPTGQLLSKIIAFPFEIKRGTKIVGKM
jgi:hypothetical protein